MVHILVTPKLKKLEQQGDELSNKIITVIELRVHLQEGSDNKERLADEKFFKILRAKKCYLTKTSSTELWVGRQGSDDSFRTSSLSLIETFKMLSAAAKEAGVDLVLPKEERIAYMDQLEKEIESEPECFMFEIDTYGGLIRNGNEGYTFKDGWRNILSNAWTSYSPEFTPKAAEVKQPDVQLPPERPKEPEIKADTKNESVHQGSLVLTENEKLKMNIKELKQGAQITIDIDRRISVPSITNLMGSTITFREYLLGMVDKDITKAKKIVEAMRADDPKALEETLGEKRTIGFGQSDGIKIYNQLRGPRS